MSQIKPSPPKFLTLLEEVLLDEEKSKQEYYAKEGYRHYPSSASVVCGSGNIVGACLRQLYYRATKEPESNPKTFTNKLQSGFGDAIHAWIASKLAKSKKISIKSEVGGRLHYDELENEISYRIDHLVNYKGEPGGAEIKTVQSLALDRMIKEDKGPKQKDILQVLCYFVVEPSMMWHNMIYFGRDSAIRAEFSVWKHPDGYFMIEGFTPYIKPSKITDLSFDGVVLRWKELEASIKAGSIPKRDFKAVLNAEGQVVSSRQKNSVKYRTDWQCMYCNYRDKCWSGEDAQENSIKVG